MNSGADLNAVKELLGHSSLASTQVYTHNTIEKLKDVFKKHTPKPEFFLKIFILNNAVKILFLIYTANIEMKHLPMM